MVFRTIDNLLTGVASGPVQAAADLLVSLDGADLQLSSVTGQVRIVVDSLFAALRIIRTQTRQLRKLDKILRTGGITAPVYVAETRIALLGSAASPDWASRRLGAGYTEVDWWGVVRAMPRDVRQRLPSLGRSG